jgi:hypothetical protein
VIHLELFFKKPSLGAREAMCQAAMELGTRENGENNHVKAAEEVLKGVTGHEHVRVVNSGNSAIMAAMSTMKDPVLIPDQGGWNGFEKIARILGMEVTDLPTKLGIIDPEILEDSIREKNPEAIFITSLAGYMAEQPLKAIYEVCEDLGVLLVEDASGAVGDPEGKLCCGEHSHIILASTGSPKIVNLGSGGFISTNNSEIFKKSSYLLKTLRASQVTCAGMTEEIKVAPDNLVSALEACSFLKEEIKFVLHPDKRGINVGIPVDNPRTTARQLREKFQVQGGGMITTCPLYNRVNIPAVCLEIKNLDIRCLNPANLRKIAETVKTVLGI